MYDESLTLETTRALCRLLDDGRLAEGITASAGAGMGYDGVVVSVPDLSCSLYFDTTFGGDDGYSPTLRCYVTLRDEPVDDGWGLPPAPAVGAGDDALAGFISAATRVVVERVLRRDVPEVVA